MCLVSGCKSELKGGNYPIPLRMNMKQKTEDLLIGMENRIPDVPEGF